MGDFAGWASVALGVGVAGWGLLALFGASLYVLVGFGHWIVDRRRRGLEPEFPSPAEREVLARVAVSEILSGGALFALRPLGAVEPPAPAPRLLRGERPVVLVPGHLQAWSCFALLGPRLSSFGLGPLYVVNHPSEDDLDRMAEALSRWIDQLRAATEARQVDVVAHGVGGLVARLAEAVPPAGGARPEVRLVGQSTPRVRRLVTLGTPHHGTETAHLWPGAIGRSLRPGSDLFARLPKPAPGQLVSIGSKHDFVVVPTESARVAPEGRDVTVRRVGHLGLLTDPEVAAEVAKALGEDVRRPWARREPVGVPAGVSAALLERSGRGRAVQRDQAPRGQGHLQGGAGVDLGQAGVGRVLLP